MKSISIKPVGVLLFGLFLSINISALAIDDTIPHILNTTIRINLDGELDELWNAVESYDITYMINGTNYPTLDDCSGYFKAVWMSDSLYLLINSTDDIISTNSGNPWENDGFEVYFDMDNSKDTVYQEDNFQFRFNMNSNDITGINGPDSYDPPDVDFKIKSYAENYSILEVVFPLVELGMEPEIAGKYLGFDVQILDNDGSGREVAMAWNNNEHEAYFNPSKMGTVLISDELIVTSIEPNFYHYNIYPNPVNNILYLESDAHIDAIRIFSVDGGLISKTDPDTDFSHILDVSELKQGLYFLEVTINSGQKKIFTFAKD